METNVGIWRGKTITAALDKAVKNAIAVECTAQGKPFKPIRLGVGYLHGSGGTRCLITMGVFCTTPADPKETAKVVVSLRFRLGLTTDHPDQECHGIVQIEFGNDLAPTGYNKLMIVCQDWSGKERLLWHFPYNPVASVLALATFLVELAGPVIASCAFGS